MTKEITIHDTFFAKNLSKKEVATDFLKTYCPESFKQMIDFDSVRLEKTNTRFITENARRFKVADLLFSVSVDHKKVFLLIHIEHQSTPNKYMPFRVMNYKSGIWLDYIDLHPDEPVPPIVSFVYYHGVKRPYPYSMKIEDLFEGLTPEQKKQLLEPILIDLSQYDDESLQTHGAMEPVDLLMKHTFDKPEENLFLKLFNALKKADSQMRVLGVEYMIDSYEWSEEAFINMASKNLDEADVMTIRQRIEQRVLQKNSEQIARNSLAKGLDVELVAEITGLSVTAVKNIKASMIKK